MEQPLLSISPVDGRYATATAPLQQYFSEYALFKYRLRIEVEYLIELGREGFPCHQAFSETELLQLKDLYLKFSVEDALRIKTLEKSTNHDIKALEYFLKEKLDALGLGKHREWIHFGLTSQDINNTAIPLSLREAVLEVILPAINEIHQLISNQAEEWKQVSMLARTHGQPASPTSLGKEMRVFAERLGIERDKLKQTVWAAKFGGATGNFNAHHVAFPNLDWVEFSNRFLNRLGLSRSQTTTQIEHYDQLAAFCHNMMRIHTILVDYSRDIWTYISMEYFRQKVKEGETGSSAMPHKVNPIDFENAEGNLAYANAILGFFADKLPVSRLQRDLTDSTVLRNLGVPLAHSLIALKSLNRGISKLLLNRSAIEGDLQKHAAVIAEAIQTILRREGYPNPYEALKELTRGKEEITITHIHEFIATLNVSDAVKTELYRITPSNYIGIIR